MLKNTITLFLEELRAGRIEVYNEFSLQHELGLFIRQSGPNWKVLFERNVSHFGFSRERFQKREIDISIINRATNALIAAIELKFPRNGQYPEQMFSFCKDICFLEQLKASGFKEGYLLILADDHLFHRGSDTGIYGYFRNQIPLSGIIEKPTGSKNETVSLAGRYTIAWQSLTEVLQNTLIEV